MNRSDQPDGTPPSQERRINSIDEALVGHLLSVSCVIFSRNAAKSDVASSSIGTEEANPENILR